MAPQLGQEEGVPAAALGELGGDAAEPLVEVAADRFRDEALDRRRVESGELQADRPVDTTEVSEAARQPVRHGVAGVTERSDDENSPRQPGSGEVTEQRQRLRAGPVQVVEHDQPGAGGRGGGEQGGERPVRAVAGGVRIDRRRPGLDVEPRRPRQQLTQRSELGGERGVGPRHHREQLVGRLHPRLVGQGQIVVTTAVQHPRPLVVLLSGELCGQPGLAGSGLSSDEHDAARAVAAVVPGAAQDGDDVVPADERTAGGAGERERERWLDRSGPVLPHHRRHVPFDRVDVDGLGQTLQLHRTERLVAVARPAAGEETDALRDEDLTSVGGGFQPRRGDHREAEVIVPVPCHVPDGHSDADTDARVLLGDVGLDRDGRVHGRRGGAEGRHHAVARVLDDVPAVPGDDGAEAAAVLDEQPVSGGFAEPAA